jgi:hypothetical protein
VIWTLRLPRGAVNSMTASLCRTVANRQPDGSPAIHPLLERACLERQLLGVATVKPELAGELARRARTDRLSSDAMTLLLAIAADPSLAWTWLPSVARSPAEYAVATSVQRLTIEELTSWSVGTLLELTNQAPPMRSEIGDVPMSCSPVLRSAAA